MPINHIVPYVLLGAGVTHPAPGSDDRPTFTSLVGSVDQSAVRYVSTIEVQTCRQEIIHGMESMCTVRFLSSTCERIDRVERQYVLTQYKSSMGNLPKRILFFRG